MKIRPGRGLVLPMASWTALGSSDVAVRLLPFLKEQMFAIEWSFSS